MYPASPLPFLAKEFLPSIWVVDFQVDRPKAYVLFDYDYSNVCVWVCVCECVCVWVWVWVWVWVSVSVSVSMCVCVLEIKMFERILCGFLFPFSHIHLKRVPRRGGRISFPWLIDFHSDLFPFLFLLAHLFSTKAAAIRSFPLSLHTGSVLPPTTGVLIGQIQLILPSP